MTFGADPPTPWDSVPRQWQVDVRASADGPWEFRSVVALESIARAAAAHFLNVDHMHDARVTRLPVTGARWRVLGTVDGVHVLVGETVSREDAQLLMDLAMVAPTCAVGDLEIVPLA